MNFWKIISVFYNSYINLFYYRVICGLTAFTTKNHIIRAALETVCYQITDVIEAMKKDAGIHLTKLHVDGKMAQNNLLMQLQADISGIPIRKFLIATANSIFITNSFQCDRRQTTRPAWAVRLPLHVLRASI